MLSARRSFLGEWIVVFSGVASEDVHEAASHPRRRCAYEIGRSAERLQSFVSMLQFCGVRGGTWNRFAHLTFVGVLSVGQHTIFRAYRARLTAVRAYVVWHICLCSCVVRFISRSRQYFSQGVRPCSLLRSVIVFP